MSKSGLWIIVAVFLVTIFALIYLASSFEAPEGTTTVILPNPTQQPEAETEALRSNAEPASSLPTIRIEPEPEAATAQAVPEVAPPPEERAIAVPEPEPAAAEVEQLELPTLNNSDVFVAEQLRGLPQGQALLERAADEQLLRKFVVLVDNLTRDNFPQTGLPYETLEGEMPVRTVDDDLYEMGEEAYARFDPLVDVFVALDTEAAMALYRSLSPLLQRAFSELGYRNAEFDDTLREAIDSVLATEELEGPFQLVKPSVMYVYADSRIENLSALQKQMLRLGPDNAERVKAKLREIREAL